MKRISWLYLVLLLPLTNHPARGDAGAAETLFQQGRTQLSLGAGYGNFNNNGYFVAALGGGYYLLDGLEAGVDGETWLGSQPQIYNVSPQLRYTFLHAPGGFTPYIGGFYRRTFYNRELDNINSAGTRAGLVFPLSSRAYFTAGAVYEHYFKCDTAIYSSCDMVYPELGFAFSY